MERGLMRVNMVVGGRYNAPPMARALARISDLRVYSSVPPGYWPGAEQCVTVVPHISILYNKITRKPPGRTFKDISTRIFNECAARIMRSADVYYTWATFGYESMKRRRREDAAFLLDRACPHIRFQEDVLSEESDRIGVPFTRSSPAFVDRCVEEYALADLIVVPSNYTKRSFVNRGVPESRIRLISLGPNVEPTQRNPARRPPSVFTVGVVAGAVLRKGLTYLVDAWETLQLPGAVLKLKCPVEELQKSPELWRRIERSRSIEVVSYMKSLEEFYRSCDLFCLPSIDEGFGMSVFEAMACGCPVLVTENVGAADIVQVGETGFIVPPRSIEALASAILHVYERPDLRAHMRQQCTAYYEHYRAHGSSFESQVSELLDFVSVRRTGALDVIA